MAKLRRQTAHRGQVLIVFACGVVVLCAVAVFAIDIGHLCASNARLQNAADAASKAAVLELYERRQAGDDEMTARQAAAEEALAIRGLNYAEAGAQIVFGRWEVGQFIPVETDPSIPATAARVKAFRSQTAPGGPERTFFGSVFGLYDVNQAEYAVARSTRPGFVPFGLWEGDVPPVGERMTIYNNEEVAPGAFGLLDYDGLPHSAEEAKRWTRYGYEAPVTLTPEPDHLVLEGTTGLKTSIKAGVAYHIAEGDVVMACIYRSIWGKASQTYFEIVGLTAITLQTQTFVDDDAEEYESITAEVVDTYFVDSGDDINDFMRELTRLQLVE